MPRPKEQEPRVVGRSENMGDEYEHPAYGQISAHRVSSSSGVPLYGSDFRHRNLVVIRIQRSRMMRSLGRDWHHSTDYIAEVELSEAQWATFVASMNVGSGVPCTIRFTEKDGHMPTLPYRHEAGAYSQDVRKKLSGLIGRVQETIRRVREVSGLSQKKQVEIFGQLDRLEKDLDDSLPFLARSFEEHMETTVEKAKIEVAAHILNEVSRTGLQALQHESMLQLGSGEEEK